MFALWVSAQEPSHLDIQLIALNGDAAPGYEDLGSTFDFNSTFAHLGPGGHIAFFETFTGSPTPPRGWFYWGEGAMRYLYQENKPIPSALREFPEHKASGFSLSGIDLEGNIAYQTLLSCLDGSNAGNCAIPVNLVGPPKFLELYRNDSWHDIPLGSGSLAINGNGWIAAVGRIFRSNILREELVLFPYFDESKNIRIASAGSKLVLLDNGPDEDLIPHSFSQIQLSEDGWVFALVSLENKDGGRLPGKVIFCGGGPSFSEEKLLAWTSQPAPGPPGQGPLEWRSFDGYKSTTQNRIALSARVGNPSVAALWFISPTDQQLAVLSGHTSFVDAQPGEFIENAGGSDYGIGRDGGIVFFGQTNFGRRGVFRWQNGSVTPLLIEGQTAPGFSDGVIGNRIAFRMNRRGDVLIQGSITNFGKPILYLLETDETTPRIIVQRGDLYQVRGEQKVLSGWAFPILSQHDVFNDRGEIVLSLSSTNPNSKTGLFLVKTSRPVKTLRFEGDDAVVAMKTIPGKRLAVRRTSDFKSFINVATGITGNGETKEVRDPGAMISFESAFYVVVIED